MKLTEAKKFAGESEAILVITLSETVPHPSAVLYQGGHFIPRERGHIVAIFLTLR